MTDLYLIFNHSITSLQCEEARESLSAGRIIDLPPDLKQLWSMVPPELEGINRYLMPLQDWLSSHARVADFILIEGDFGATYLMVQFAFKKGLVPIYSTTDRDAVEEHDPDGTIRLVHHFKHCRFRKYGL